jgi:DNA-binding transcriptional ArsR family regulator
VNVARNGKTQLSPEALELVAARFRVLGEPVRLRILQRLQEGECAVTELAHLLETTQPNVSKHLKLLQETGLVARRQEKNTVYYSLADDSVFALCELVCSRLQERLAAQAGALAQALPAQRKRPR